MLDEKVTYEKLHQLLTRLGFVCRKAPPRWKRYEHSDSDTVIIVGDRKPSEKALLSEVVSTRRHLVEKGLISEEDLDEFLSRTSPTKKAARS